MTITLIRRHAAEPQAPPPVIYVDAAIHAWRGKMWCHLFSEDIAALHVFAARLGLKFEWFQAPPKATWSHYDVTASKRRIAVSLGAVETGPTTLMEIVGKQRGTWEQAKDRWLALREKRVAAGMLP